VYLSASFTSTPTPFSRSVSYSAPVWRFVFFAGLYVFRIRKRLFDRDPQVTGDNYGARNLRLWQVILVWILAIDLLITAIFTV